MLRGLTIAASFCAIFALSISGYKSDAAESFSEPIDGSISPAGCGAIGGTVERVSVIEDNEDLNIEICNYRKWNFQLTPTGICPAMTGTWVDPETGKEFTLGYACDAPVMPLPNCGRAIRFDEYVFERFSSYYNEMVRNDATGGRPYYFQIGLGGDILCTGWNFDPNAKRLEIDLSARLDGNLHSRLVNVTIPKDVLGGSFAIFVDGTQTSNFKVLKNANSNTLITEIFIPSGFDGIGRKVAIQGTEAIPEFPAISSILAITFAFSIIIIAYVRKLSGRVS